MKLKEKVLEEATNIKKFVAKRVRRKLSYQKLNPHNSNYCVYGQMFWDCYTDEGMKVKSLCSSPYSKDLTLYIRTRQKEFDESVFSALEYYIARPYAKNKNLIDFLKDKRELTVDDL